ncbi:MAG: hypothetical protein HOO06_15910 [Bdellovibrionaceae bacterium]|jgi:hypothetical protein|nr:hypothetical protein [Pseudobdellovibrionaceae bacterium]
MKRNIAISLCILFSSIIFAQNDINNQLKHTTPQETCKMPTSLTNKTMASWLVKEVDSLGTCIVFKARTNEVNTTNLYAIDLAATTYDPILQTIIPLHIESPSHEFLQHSQGQQFLRDFKVLIEKGSCACPD